jgi:hypothetical protein
LDKLGLQEDIYVLKKQTATSATDGVWNVDTNSGSVWFDDDSAMIGAYAIHPSDSGGTAYVSNTYLHESNNWASYTKHEVGAKFNIEFECDKKGKVQYVDGEGPRADPNFDSGIAYAHMKIDLSGMGTSKVKISVEIKTGASATVTVGASGSVTGGIGGHEGAPGASATLGTTYSWTGSAGVSKGTTKFWYVECICLE